MPKARKTVKINNRVQKFNVQRKFRVGSRKSPVSALLMSNEGLKAALVDPNKRRYRNNIAAVLRMRGIAA